MVVFEWPQTLCMPLSSLPRVALYLISHRMFQVLRGGNEQIPCGLISVMATCSADVAQPCSQRVFSPCQGQVGTSMVCVWD